MLPLLRLVTYHTETNRPFGPGRLSTRVSVPHSSSGEGGDLLMPLTAQSGSLFANPTYRLLSRAVAASPLEEAPRLALADWIEESAPLSPENIARAGAIRASVTAKRSSLTSSPASKQLESIAGLASLMGEPGPEGFPFDVSRWAGRFHFPIRFLWSGGFPSGVELPEFSTAALPPVVFEWFPLTAISVAERPWAGLRGDASTGWRSYPGDVLRACFAQIPREFLAIGEEMAATADDAARRVSRLAVDCGRVLAGLPRLWTTPPEPSHSSVGDDCEVPF